ncbi:hypothetical protein M513_02324 [Trichuris suis]|uniref:Uncharacterized protein n=1 Tax=Trichuris suis TaxID=68888 RepID=A0A085MHF2_9BILA|nr:hypothetical protein M513_02324 [Trichuris suis]
MFLFYGKFDVLSEKSVQMVKESFFVPFLDYRKDVIHVTFEEFDTASEAVAREGSVPGVP